MIGTRASQAFSPNKIANLKIWLDASDPGMITAVDGLVSRWKDKSTNGYHARQTTGALKPRTHLHTMNRLNVLTYNGVDDALKILASHITADLFRGGGSIFAAVNPLTAGENNYDRIFDKGGRTINYIASPEGGKAKYAHISKFPSTLGTFLTTTRDVLLGAGNILVTLYDSSLASNRPVFRVNGRRRITQTIQAPEGSARSDAGGDLVMGNNPNGNRTWDGYLGEILMFNRILTDSETAALETYLANKWGVAIP